MAAAGRLEELELSSEEAERLQRAFRDEKFRALFAEYAAELADPEQRRLYEEEVAALERERGMEVRFVHPAAGYVLRTSQAGSRRCYLNVCSNPHVGTPQARPEPGGHRWALPYSLAPGREELGRGGQRRLIYDVVFHPAALRLAARSSRFRRLLSDTALAAVERHCSVQLDRANATVLRGTKYKGVPQAPVIRTPLPGGAPPPPADGDALLPPFPFPPTTPQPPAAAAAPSAAQPSGPTTPRWSIRHRSYVDLQDYRYCRDSAPSPVPRELVVTVELPLLRSAAQATLEIHDRELRLDSERPAYRLRLRLPHAVDEHGGRAAFDKARRQLVVTLPVARQPGPEGPLDFPPANKLVSPETSLSVSAHNAAIGLTKAPDSTGPWDKFCFGLDASTLQERLFISEENIDGFLDTVLCPSFCSQPALESQPLIETLDFTEDRIRIRLKPQEAACSDRYGTGTTLSSSGGDPAEESNGNCPQTKAETKCTTAETDEGERAAGTSTTSTPSAAAETMGKVGCSSHHCLQHEPSDVGSATPDQSTREEPGLNSAVAAGKAAVATGSDKRTGGQVEGAEDEGAAPSGSKESNQYNRAASPALREVSAEDGSVQVVRLHARPCPFVFQNDFLYDLD
ncbi:protein kintoun isoform X3 [Pogoniulus pusillus]|uniref:protein kintoun isoform X3 n=1 Tax=Pogoniulus pusillus TaxID=488313 RepID=UPI0030B984B5